MTDDPMRNDPTNDPVIDETVTEETVTQETVTEETVTEETPKRKRDKRKVEWAFDFAQFGESFKNMMSSFAGDEEVQESHFETLIGQSQRAEMDIDFSVGTGNITVLPPESEYLMVADLKHLGEVELNVEGEAIRQVQLRQKPKVNMDTMRQGFRAFANNEKLHWDIQLSPAVPMELDIDGGVGPIKADLTGMTLTRLEIDNGVGSITLTLPIQEAPMTVDLDGGVGQSNIHIPEGFDGRIDIDGGVGTVELFVPASAAIQITVDSGIGSVNLPPQLQRVSGKSEFMGNSGVWQTEGFALAERRIIVHYDAGVGTFRMQNHPIV